MTVLNADGRRVAGAAITGFGAPWFADLVGEPDFVRARSDAQGRVKLSLLPGRSYSIRAAQFVDEERLASGVLERALVAGGAVTVKLARPAAVQVRLLPILSSGYARALDSALPVQPLRGLDAWQAFAPLSVQVSPVARGGFFTPADEWPPAPYFRLRVLAQNGEPIWEGSAVEAKEQGVPAPRALPVRVVDKHSKGLAGVRLYQAVPGSVAAASQTAAQTMRAAAERMVGVTDASGQATVSIAMRVAKGMVKTPILLHARAAGFAHGRAGIRGGSQAAGSNTGPFSGHLPIRVPDNHVLPIELRRCQPLRIEPAAVARITVVGKAIGAQVAPYERPIVIETDSRGRAWLPLRSGRDRARIGRVERRGHVPFWCCVVQGASGYDVDCAVSTVRLQVRGRDGKPMRAAELLLVPLQPHLSVPGIQVPVHLDAAGRAAIDLHVGTSWLLWCHHGEDLAWHFVAEGASGVEDVVLALAPMPRVTLRLVDAEGKAIANREIARGGATHLAAADASDQDRLLAGMHSTLTGRRLRKGRHGLPSTNERGEIWYPLLPIKDAFLDLRLGSRTGLRARVKMRSGEQKTVVMR